eukprot:883345-Pyramimonas_sp.AAC.1
MITRERTCGGRAREMRPSAGDSACGPFQGKLKFALFVTVYSLRPFVRVKSTAPVAFGVEEFFRRRRLG